MNFSILASFGSGINSNTGPTPRRPRKRNVAPESGANGLDEEYMFTARDSRPDSSFSNKENFFTADAASYRDDSDSDGEYIAAKKVLFTSKKY